LQAVSTHSGNSCTPVLMHVLTMYSQPDIIIYSSHN